MCQKPDHDGERRLSLSADCEPRKHRNEESEEVRERGKRKRRDADPLEVGPRTLAVWLETAAIAQSTLAMERVIRAVQVLPMERRLFVPCLGTR
jgi:hypothetical protein